MDSGIQDFVAGQAGVGQRDSEGEFTINQAKAWEKLGALALPNEMAWIAKIVQSAMAARVALAVQQSRDETIFTWGSGVDWSHAQLEGAVFGSGPVADRGLAHLAIAVRALACHKSNFVFSVKYANGEKATWNGAAFEVKVQSTAGIRDPRLSLTVSHGLPDAGWVVGAMARTAVGASFAMALEIYAQWAPRAVTLDGRELSNVIAGKGFGASEIRHPLCLLTALPQDGLPEFRVRAKLDPQPRARIASGDLADQAGDVSQALQGLERPLSSLGLVTYFLHKVRVGTNKTDYRPSAKPSQLVWLDDGVMVHSENLPLPRTPVALCVACSAQDLETDLTGMVLRETAERERRKALAVRAISSLFPAPACQVQVQMVTKETAPEQSQCGLVIALTGAASLPFVPPLGIFLMVVGGWFWKSSAASARAETQGEEQRNHYTNLATALDAYAKSLPSP